MTSERSALKERDRLDDSPRTVSVSNGAELASALRSAKAGQTIALADGVYRSPNGQFTATIPGLTLRATNPHKARLTSDLVLRGSDQRADRLFLDRSSVRIAGDRVQLSNSRIFGTEGTAVSISKGVDVRVAYNELFGIRGKGISIGPDPRNPEALQRPRIDHNYIRDFVGERNGESYAGIKVGETLTHSDISVKAIVEYNLVSNLDLVHSAVSIKSSDNVIRYNTLLDSKGGIVNRHGERNRLEGNWVENSLGIWIRDEDNIAAGNKVIRSHGIGLRVMAGTVDPNSRQKGYPYAASTTLIRNDTDRLIVGFGWGNHRLPAVGTRIIGNQGAKPEITKLARSTVTAATGGEAPKAIRMDLSDVGPRVGRKRIGSELDDPKNGTSPASVPSFEGHGRRSQHSRHARLAMAVDRIREWDKAVALPEHRSGLGSTRAYRAHHAIAAFAPREGVNGRLSGERPHSRKEAVLASGSDHRRRRLGTT